MLVEFQAIQRKESDWKVKITCNFPPVLQSSLGLKGQKAMKTDEPMHGNPQASTSTSMKQPEPNCPITLEMEIILDSVL